MLHLTFSPHTASFRKQIKILCEKFPAARKKILSMPFSNLPWKSLAGISDLKLPRGINTLAVVGIGGSALGAKAITAGLNKHSVVYFNNIDPDFVEQQLKCLDPKKTLFCIASKSGETIEILSLARILLKLAPRKNFLVLTDSHSSSLSKLAKKRGIPILESPKGVAGRFSVLSSVGLLPAQLLGIPAREILKGAKGVSWKDAFSLAAHQYLHFQKGKNIVVFFPYGESMNALGNWYMQLLAESIGKSKKIGITPTMAMGVKDQHSLLQLFLDGPDDKFYILLKPENPQRDYKIPGMQFSLKMLFDSEYEGVKQSFIKRQKPFLEISFPFVSPKTVGELLFLFELEAAFLGELFSVQTMNQPAVELSKTITKKLLKTH